MSTDKMSTVHNVDTFLKCRQDKMSTGQNVDKTKCRQDKMSICELPEKMSTTCRQKNILSPKKLKN